MQRTRIKFCGFTRAQDVQAAVEAGADALGFVFYDQSPRYISPAMASPLIQSVPAFISTVGLFVNMTVPQMTRVITQAPITAIQLHGDETWHFALNVKKILRRPVIKAVRVNEQTDWEEIEHYVDQLAGVLLDADALGYGGAGHVFDWSVIPAAVRSKIILSGGLKLANIGEAIEQVRPYGLDVSSGIETDTKGIKDAQAMQDFVRQVVRADAG